MDLKVKICGITTLGDAWMAIDAGADYLGFVCEPTSPRFVAQRVVEAIVADLPREVVTVAVFGRFDLLRLPSGVMAAQSLDRRPAGLPEDLAYFRAVRPRSIAEVDPILGELEGVDRVVADAYSPEAFGGTGTVVDWGLALQIREALPVTMLLAGGLTPHNVREAIELVKPYGVDVSSGVERSPGVKDPKLVRKFVNAAKRAGGRSK